MLARALVILLAGALVFGLASDLSSASGHSGDVLSGLGTATVDGVISPGEYDSCIGPITQVLAGRIRATREFTEVTYIFTICVMNDSENAYYAVEISDTTDDIADQATFYFDNDHNGAVVACNGDVEDYLVFVVLSGFADRNYCFPHLPPEFKDAQQHGVGVRLLTDVGSVYEMSHPLNSGDAEDYSLSPGSTVGWCLIYQDASFAGGPLGDIQLPSGCFTDLSSADASEWADVQVVDSGQQTLIAQYGILIVAIVAVALALVYMRRRRAK